MEELLEVEWSEPSETIKQRFKKALGQEIPVDYFMYSCLEEERTYRALGQDALHSDRWEVFRQPEDIIAASLQERPLDALIVELFQWYKQQYSTFTEEKPLDLARLTWFTKYFVLLKLDLEKIILAKAPEEALKEKNFSIAKEKLLEHLPFHAHLMLGYLEWSMLYNESDASLQIDLASVPPTGRFISLIKRKLRQMRNGFSSSRGSSPQGRRSPHFENRGDRGDDRDRGGDRNRPSSQASQERGRRDSSSRDSARPSNNRRDASSASKDPRQSAQSRREPSSSREPRESRESRESREPRQNRFERGRGGEKERNDRDGNRSDGNRGRGREGFQRDKRPPSTDVEKQNIALAEVEQAIKRLDSEPGLKEIRLKPQNSFVRRLQHQKAVDDTRYASESIGEGADRSVIIQRK